jgi:hypothetical protein
MLRGPKKFLIRIHFLDLKKNSGNEKSRIPEFECENFEYANNFLAKKHQEILDFLRDPNHIYSTKSTTDFMGRLGEKGFYKNLNNIFLYPETSNIIDLELVLSEKAIELNKKCTPCGKNDYFFCGNYK